MFEGSNLHDLLDSRWTATHWQLLAVLAAPLAYFLVRAVYDWLYRTRGPSWLERQIGADLSDGSPSSPFWAGLAGVLVGSQASADEAAKAQSGRPEEPFRQVVQVARVMARYDAPWCFAGGWALDLFLGRVSRQHKDVEVAVLRRDQGLLWEYLLGWHPMYVLPGSADRRPWLKGELLKLPVHELHTKPPQAAVASLEILLNESDGDDWVYRRNAQVRMTLSRAIRFNKEGLPYLAPEIVLLYKSKHARQADESDLTNALPRLSETQRRWLHDALRAADPRHTWLRQLR